mmetsp:Transcript_13891/g.33118  ORF Transcript_13891/g.33118 Transcript_13891/m.33118 type:complete len:105 (-) Transcript_13891:28-342(-)
MLEMPLLVIRLFKEGQSRWANDFIDAELRRRPARGWHLDVPGLISKQQPCWHAIQLVQRSIHSYIGGGGGSARDEREHGMRRFLHELVREVAETLDPAERAGTQ